MYGTGMMEPGGQQGEEEERKGRKCTVVHQRCKGNRLFSGSASIAKAQSIFVNRILNLHRTKIAKGPQP